MGELHPFYLYTYMLQNKPSVLCEWGAEEPEVGPYTQAAGNLVEDILQAQALQISSLITTQCHHMAIRVLINVTKHSQLFFACICL